MTDDIGYVGGAPRSVWEALPSAIVIHDAGGRVIFANSRAHEMVGTNPQVGCRKWSLLTRQMRLIQPDGAPARRLVPVVRRLGKPLVNVPLGLLRPDGDVLWQSASCVPVVDMEHGTCCYVTSVVEVKERHLLTELTGWMQEEQVQSILGVALVLDGLRAHGETDAVRAGIAWAEERLRNCGTETRGKLRRVRLLLAESVPSPRTP